MKKLIPLLLTLSLLFSGCAPEPSKPSSETGLRQVSAPDGQVYSVPVSPGRIIAATPTVAEILADVGAADRVAAIDQYGADIPGYAPDLPKIDFMSPDLEALIALKPDLLIASDIVKSSGKDDPFAQLSALGIPVIYLKDADSLAGIEESVVFVADLAGEREKGEELAGEMKDELARIAKIGEKIPQRRSVYFEISPAPSLYTFGSGVYLGEVLELVGCDNIFREQTGWLSVSAESVAAKNPDVILTTVNYLDDPVGEILSRKGWSQVNAVKDRRVYQIPTNAASRPTHHVVEAARAIAQAVYPEYYHEKPAD